MIDTVHFDSSWTLVDTRHPDWKTNYQTERLLRAKQDVPEGRIKMIHEPTGIHAYGSVKSGELTRFYVPSLPALLHGQNGMPLNGQPEIDAALEVLDELIGQVARGGEGVRTFTRVDMSLNLRDLPYGDIEPAIQRTNLPRSKQTPMIYVGESITFRRAHTELQFYDKLKQFEAKGKLTERQRQRLESVTRVELRLNGKDLNREMGKLPCRGSKGGPVIKLDLMEAYRCLREHVISLGLTRVEGVNDIVTFLAHVSSRDPEYFDLYLRKCCKPSYRPQLKRKVAKAMPLLAEKPVDWEALLPPDRPPVETQIYIPGALPEWQREIVERVRERCGIGKGPEAAYEALRKGR